MRSQCEFFMSPEDEVAFLQFAAAKYNLGVHGNWLSNDALPPEGLQFLPSKRFDLDLIAGRISIATVDGASRSDSASMPAHLERVYRGLRSYIRKHFNNK